MLDLDDLLEDDEFNSVDLFEISKPKIGDLIYYNQVNQKFDILTLSSFDKSKTDDKVIIGIIINFNDDNTIDIITKNFLTSERNIVPFNYLGKEQHIGPYLKQLFDRFLNKYQRTSDIDITTFKYNIPNIALLDYTEKHINTIYETMRTAWNDDRANDFINRLYDNGVLSIYKGKFYKWLPNKEKKREIKNLESGTTVEFLPVFKLEYNY